MRLILTFCLSSIISVCLFYLMSELVNTEDNLLPDASENTSVEFLRTKTDSESSTRERSLPKKPPEATPPPALPSQEVTNEAVGPDTLALETPAMDTKFSGGIPFLGGGGGEIMPIVRILPQMPRKAAMNGIEGYVVAKFTVTKDGQTKDVSIIEAKPPRIFNRSAQQAILKWKYKPQFQDGKPVEIEQTVRLEYKLEDE